MSRISFSHVSFFQLRADSTSDLRGSGRSSIGEIERYGTMPKHYSLDSFRNVAGSPNGVKDQNVLPNKPQFNLGGCPYQAFSPVASLVKSLVCHGKGA
jgi:hypothetical protein